MPVKQQTSSKAGTAELKRVEDVKPCIWAPIVYSPLEQQVCGNPRMRKLMQLNSPVIANLECKNRRLYNPSDGKITNVMPE